MTDEVECLVAIDNREATIGAKRNQLLKDSTGDYVCFIDDDDIVSEEYVERILEGTHSGADCISFRTIITFNDKNPSVVYNSLQFTESIPIALPCAVIKHHRHASPTRFVDICENK